MSEEKDNALILWFKDLSLSDVRFVGGKNASLGEMYKELTQKGVNIPNGFAITAKAYNYFIDKAGIRDSIKKIVESLDKGKPGDLEKRGEKIRSLIMGASFPDDLTQAITKAYQQLESEYNEDVDVAVRSSATAEDMPEASFAGQHESYLNIKGKNSLLFACKRCFASLFTNRAISYRIDHNFDHMSVYLSIGVQKMVRSDKSISGVMFSIDTESGFKDVALITASWGLGENIVQGAVNPDEYIVFKPTLQEGYKPIITKKLGSKELRMVYSSSGTKNTHTPKEDRHIFCCSDEDVLLLANWSCVIENHYTQKNKGKFTPMDIEWAKDGITNELFIVQARPETVHSLENKNKIRKFLLKGQGKIIVTGSSIGSSIATGVAKVIKDVHGLNDIKKGDILVTSMTDPDWEPALKQVTGIITNRGGRTCHAAIISRELGIPCIVGCGNATESIKTGQEITIDCSSGEQGRVLEGKVEFETREINVSEIPKLRTKIMMNVANPDAALDLSSLPNSGVGLARLEFIISNHIKAHPLALLHLNEQESKVKKDIQKIMMGYPNGKEFFISKLSQGIGMIAAAFYPNPVILRFSDFKTDEYANLIGGEKYEPKESNPMIGWRGASRYYDEKYKEGFALECEAVKRVREIFGLKNLQVMIPFCRTIEEAKKVILEMSKNGLVQHKDGLQVIGMCEVPSNVVLAEEFLDILDGYSIGSNDLTQLVLGVDRNSQILTHLFDERNEAVKKMISQVIQVARRKKKYIGICGQAPSDFPEFAEFLVNEGIESMSLNPDSVVNTIFKVSEAEKKFQGGKPIHE